MAYTQPSIRSGELFTANGYTFQAVADNEIEGMIDQDPSDFTAQTTIMVSISKDGEEVAEVSQHVYLWFAPEGYDYKTDQWGKDVYTWQWFGDDWCIAFPEHDYDPYLTTNEEIEAITGKDGTVGFHAFWRAHDLAIQSLCKLLENDVSALRIDEIFSD